MSIKNSSDTIGNRTRDLPTCSAVPQGIAGLLFLLPTCASRQPICFFVCCSICLLSSLDYWSWSHNCFVSFIFSFSAACTSYICVCIYIYCYSQHVSLYSGLYTCSTCSLGYVSVLLLLFTLISVKFYYSNGGCCCFFGI